MNIGTKRTLLGVLALVVGAPGLAASVLQHRLFVEMFDDDRIAWAITGVNFSAGLVASVAGFALLTKKRWAGYATLGCSAVFTLPLVFMAGRSLLRIIQGEAVNLWLVTLVMAGVMLVVPVGVAWFARSKELRDELEASPDS